MTKAFQKYVQEVEGNYKVRQSQAPQKEIERQVLARMYEAIHKHDDNESHTELEEKSENLDKDYEFTQTSVECTQSSAERTQTSAERTQTSAEYTMLSTLESKTQLLIVLSIWFNDHKTDIPL